MQKLGLKQLLTQKLSPQQIQFIKLLQIPTAEFEARIEEELEVNPALEEGNRDQKTDDYEDDNKKDKEDLNVDEYLRDDDYAGYKMYGDGNYPAEEDRKEIPLSTTESLHENLKKQLNYLRLDERQHTIGLQLVGSIESDGYIRRDLEAIVNDLAFSQNIETSLEEVESILTKIQNLEPPGIGARNLQECLLIQLKRKNTKNQEVNNAIKILEDNFDAFSKKHFEKITKKLNISEEELKSIIEIITKLNPKPGGSIGGGNLKTHYVIPDFILINNDGDLELKLNSKNAPELKISRSFSEMIDTYEKSDKKDKKMRETITFVKQKLDAAKWFIDAIKQRQQTLMSTMNAIIEQQYEYFIDGDESKLRPMILKDIAEKVGLDISTISRVANSKTIQTDFGTFPLKHFFSEAITTDSGDDVSNREVKNVLKKFIEDEDKRKPLSDDKLEKLLKEKGYSIARRTVAKYREQLNIPVARLRKEL